MSRITTGRVEGLALSRLVYRSRAVRPMSPLDLYELTCAAQLRNNALSITGLVLYDDGRFYQWLEGPSENIRRIIRSIRHDTRHTDLEILDDQSAKTRMFTDWSMKLATASRVSEAWQQEIMDPPPSLIAQLRQHPHAAPRLLATLTLDAPGIFGDLPISARTPRDSHAAAILRTIIAESVIPSIARQHGFPSTRPRPGSLTRRADELADLLVADELDGARALIQEVHGETPRSLQPFATLLEPAARKLGDLWSEDLCSEFDVTLGLSTMQTAARLLGLDANRRPGSILAGRNVLIAPEPGECHGLGAVLDSEVMWNAGWQPHCEYPKDDRALETLVAETWFDALDLSLSAAFRRQHWLPRLQKTIAAARHASLNPGLIVVVGGRVFAEHPAASTQVGADAVSTTAVTIDRSIMGSLRVSNGAWSHRHPW